MEIMIFSSYICIFRVISSFIHSTVRKPGGVLSVCSVQHSSFLSTFSYHLDGSSARFFFGLSSLINACTNYSKCGLPRRGHFDKKRRLEKNINRKERCRVTDCLAEELH